MAMFFFSISGSRFISTHCDHSLLISMARPDVTYVAAILLTSLDRRYIIANASWLAGSGLTIFLDLFVVAQFAIYNTQDSKRKRAGQSRGGAELSRDEQNAEGG